MILRRVNFFPGVNSSVIPGVISQVFTSDFHSDISKMFNIEKFA